MNDRVFDAVARRAACALDRRSLLGLVTSAALAAAVSQRTMASKNHHRHPDGGGGGGGGNNDKDKKCKEQAKKFRRQWENECLSRYHANFAAAADCSNCFDICGDYLATCRKNDADPCTLACFDYWF